MPYGDLEMGNIGSGNGVLPDSTKPLPEPLLIYHQGGPVTIAWGLFCNYKISSKITILKFP